MRIHDFPTILVYKLSARCAGLYIASGERRIVYQACATACDEEIDRRIGGADFPLLAEETAAKIAEMINADFPEFNKFLFELEK